LSQSEFFPKLPNLLTDSLFVSRQDRPERKVKSHQRPEHKTVSNTAGWIPSSFKAHDVARQSLIEKGQQNVGSTLHKSLAPLLEQHHTIRKLFHESNTIATATKKNSNTMLQRQYQCQQWLPRQWQCEL